MKSIEEKLFLYRDLKYRDFTYKLCPNLDYNFIIGVKTPNIRKIAKELSYEEIEEFLLELPHKYHEENILHAVLLSNYSNNIDILLSKIEDFIPYMNSWAVTDIVSPKLFKKYPDIVYAHIKKWVHSEYEYSVRFGVVSMLQFFLDDNFEVDMLKFVCNICRDEYYIKMAIAWYFSFALIKQYDDAIIIIEGKFLDKWIHNKSIQKAIESYRVDVNKKNYLKSLKIR